MVALIAGVVKLVTPVPPATTEPPVGAVYQSTVVPATALAPNTTVPVPQRAPAVPVGTAGDAFTVAITAVLGDRQFVAVDRTAAKYVVVVLMDGVVNVVPDAKITVLVLVAYHSIVPAKGVDAESVTVPDPHLEPAVPAGAVTTVATTAARVGDAQVFNLDST